MQYWKPGAIYEVPCPQCSRQVEFFKDDTARRCPGCGHRFVNPKLDFGCAAYCQFAEQCIGTLPPEVMAEQENLFKDRVALAVKRHYRQDFRAIGRASRVARYAEQIGKLEQANLPVLLSAAYLHGVDVDAARELLLKLRAPTPLVEAVTALLDTLTEADSSDDPEPRILRDAQRMAQIEEARQAGEAAPSIVDAEWLTAGARELAAAG